MSSASAPISTDLVPANIAQQVPSIEAQSKAIVVSDQATYDQAAALYKAALEIEKEIENELGTAKKKTHDAWKDASDRFNRYMNPVIEAKRLFTRKCGEYEAEQKRIQDEAQRKADEEARAKEEADRLANAVQAEQEGAPPEEVEAILETPAPVEYHPVQPSFERKKGVVHTRPYSCTVDNLALLVCHIAGTKRLAHPDLINFLLPNQVKLNSEARTKENMMNLPGCRSGRF